jgi:hypothetical protein
MFTSRNKFYLYTTSRARRKKPPTAAELVKQMDADKDGKLSKTEVKGPLKMILLK